MSKAMLATTKGTNLIAKGKKQHKQEMGQKGGTTQARNGAKREEQCMTRAGICD